MFQYIILKLENRFLYLVCLRKLYGQIIFLFTLTNAFVCFCWIFFRADSLDTAITVITRIFTFSRGITHIYSWTIFALVLMVICHVSTYCHSKQRQRIAIAHRLITIRNCDEIYRIDGEK